MLTGIPREAIRFAFSPVQEVTRALKVFLEPYRHAEQMAWLRRARRRATPELKKAAKRFGCLLTPVPEVFPDVFPSRRAHTLDRELALLAKSRRAFAEAMVRRFSGKHFLMRADLTPRARAGALARVLHETGCIDCDEVQERFCALIGEFFERCVAPQWEEFQSLALRDARAREALMERFGLVATLRTLTRELAATGDRAKATLEFGTSETRYKHVDFPSNGKVVLTPSYFIWPHATFVVLRSKTLDVRIAYPLSSPTRAQRSLADYEKSAQRFAALGDPTRLRMLALLANRQLSTREIAGMLGLTEGGVSRHLSVLRQAGFVTPVRESYFVLYTQTTLASALLAQAVFLDERSA